MSRVQKHPVLALGGRFLGSGQCVSVTFFIVAVRIVILVLINYLYVFSIKINKNIPIHNIYYYPIWVLSVLIG